MKLVTFDGTHFAISLKSLLGTLLAGHPDSEQILGEVTAGRLSLRIIIDQAADVLTLTTQQDGEQRLVATVDMAAGASAWPIVYPDSQAPPADVAQPVH